MVYTRQQRSRQPTLDTHLHTRHNRCFLICTPKSFAYNTCLKRNTKFACQCNPRRCMLFPVSEQPDKVTWRKPHQISFLLLTISLRSTNHQPKYDLDRFSCFCRAQALGRQTQHRHRHRSMIAIGRMSCIRCSL